MVSHRRELDRKQAWLGGHNHGPKSPAQVTCLSQASWPPGGVYRSSHHHLQSASKQRSFPRRRTGNVQVRLASLCLFLCPLGLEQWELGLALVDGSHSRVTGGKPGEPPMCFYFACFALVGSTRLTFPAVSLHTLRNQGCLWARLI